MTEVSRTLEKLYTEYCACDALVARLKSEVDSGIFQAMQKLAQQEGEFEKNCRQLSNYLGVAAFENIRYMSSSYPST